MLDKLTKICCGKPVLHFGKKPLLVPNQPLDCLANQGITVLPALGRNPTQFELKFRRDINLHTLIVAGLRGEVKNR